MMGDGGVDGVDLAAFADCLTAPGTGILGGCNNVDLDLDIDVDQADLAFFELNCGTGM